MAETDISLTCRASNRAILSILCCLLFCGGMITLMLVYMEPGDAGWVWPVSALFALGGGTYIYFELPLLFSDGLYRYECNPERVAFAFPGEDGREDFSVQLSDVKSVMKVILTAGRENRIAYYLELYGAKCMVIPKICGRSATDIAIDVRKASMHRIQLREIEYEEFEKYELLN